MLKITNARVFFQGQFIEKDVGIEDGRVMHIGRVPEADETFDAGGQWLLPGLIDPHVHFREPGATHKEDFLSGSRAALAGGFTSVIDMPNNTPPTTTRVALEEKQKLVQKALCEVFFHFGASDDNRAEVRRVQPHSMKLYMNKTTGTLNLEEPALIEGHFANFDKTKPLVVHAEGPQIAQAVSLAQKYDRRLHLAHASTADAVLQAKSWAKATVEAAPHHLYLSNSYLQNHPGLGSVKPPLEPKVQCDKLWSALGQIDCIATDHAPHTLEEKAQGAYGFPGLETSFALMFKAYLEKKLPFHWIMQRMSENPAAIFGLSKRGKIEKGYFANLILFDSKKEWIVQGEELETKCKWSPFEGMVLKGKTKAAWVHGKLVLQEGDFL